MVLNEQIVILLIAVHLVTVFGFFTLKRFRLSEKFRSSQAHPANLGNTAFQVGGLVIVPITIVAVIALFHVSKNIPVEVQLTFCMPIFLLFVTGFIDDYRPISASLRLAIQIASAASIVLFVYQMTEYVGLNSLTSAVGYLAPSIFMIITVCWLINTTNFIDGMDLFLVVNVVPGSLLFAFIYIQTGQDILASTIFIVFLSSLAGFVWFNRPKASIYMGDAGALCIGALLGSCGVFILAKYGSIAGFIPFTAILVDTTFTLLRIIANGNNPLNSHSRHAYQIAAKNGKSENSIRALYFTVSAINTLLAFLCFHFIFVFSWELLFGMMAFLLSTALFIYLHSTSPTKNTGTKIDS